MDDIFHNRTVIIPQPILITHIHISLVSVWEVNFVLSFDFKPSINNKITKFNVCSLVKNDISETAYA